ncbi:MAG: hypothetical protein MSJ26_00930 [Oscillospiraceae bacterium]|nr:hypothetical protein [Oscillospiraceae bacterium]
MKQDYNSKTFTEKEKKLISAANWLTSLGVLFNGIIVLIINKFDRIGSLYLYSYIAALGLFAISVLSYLVLYIVGLRKIKPYLLRYTVIAVLLALLLAMHSKDIASQLCDKSLESKISLSENYLIIHSSSIKVEYYPNSEIFLSVDIGD